MESTENVTEIPVETIAKVEDPAKVNRNGQVANNEACCHEEDEEQPASTTKKVSKDEEKKHKYSVWDVMCVFISLFTYVFDQVTDIVVAVYFYNRQMYWYFGLTLAFVVVPSLTMTTFSLTWYIQDYKNGSRPPGSRLQWTIRAICLFLNFGPILRYFESLCYGCQLLRKKAKPSKKESYFYIMVYEDTDASLLRLFECFMESAPQLVLQIYILVKNEIPETLEDPLKIGLQILSISTSLVSLSWAIASYNRSLRFSLDEKMKLNWSATIFQFIWRFFNISSRVLSLALFASVWPLYVFIVVGVHWLVMTVWIMIQKTHFCNRRWEELFFDMVMGVVYIFCFINLKEEPTRYKNLAYHVLVFMEGTAIMLTWYLTCVPTVWYHLPALLGFFATFFIGVLLMIAYYLYFHPTVSFRRQVSVNGDMPDGVVPSSLHKTCQCGPAKKLSRRPRIESMSFEETVKL